MGTVVDRKHAGGDLRPAKTRIHGFAKPMTVTTPSFRSSINNYAYNLYQKNNSHPNLANFCHTWSFEV
ncbi:hypothetical protein PoMZ_09423, partial [Pyricularia oryzae]